MRYLHIGEPHNTDNINILNVPQKTRLWWINIAGKNKTYLGLRVHCKVFFPDFNQIWIFSSFLHKTPT